jgi:hypothetical protein
MGRLTEEHFKDAAEKQAQPKKSTDTAPFDPKLQIITVGMLPHPSDGF